MNACVQDGREKAWGSGTVAGCSVGRGEEVGGGRRRAGVGRRRAIAYCIGLRCACAPDGDALT